MSDLILIVLAVIILMSAGMIVAGLLAHAADEVERWRLERDIARRLKEIDGR